MRKLVNYSSIYLVLLSISTITLADSKITKSEFPNPNTSYLKQVPRYELQEVSLLDTGLTKDQIRHILGNPHFKEGLIAKQWNYVLDIKRNNGKFQRCEAKFEFGEKNIANNLSWRGIGCGPETFSSLERFELKQLTEKIVKRQEKTAYVIFPFNKSDLNSVFKLNPNFVRIVETIRQTQNNDDILVEGYTDRLGKPSYNRKLALKRASNVAHYLTKNGISANRIKIRAIGQTNDFNDCLNVIQSSNKQYLKACLEPNRRVNVIW